MLIILPWEAPEWSWSKWTATNTSNWRQWPGCIASSNFLPLRRGSCPRTAPMCTEKLLGKTAQTTVSLWRIARTCGTLDPGPTLSQPTCRRNGAVVHRKLIWNFIETQDEDLGSNKDFLVIPEQSIRHNSPRLDFVGHFLRDITGWWGDYAAGRLGMLFYFISSGLWMFCNWPGYCFRFHGVVEQLLKIPTHKVQDGLRNNRHGHCVNCDLWTALSQWETTSD